MSISFGIKFFTMIDSCSAFFSIPVEESSQYLFAFTWEEKQFTLTIMPQGFTESYYFLQILKTDLDDINFPRVEPRGSTLLQCIDDLLFDLLKPPQRKTTSPC